MLRTLRDLIAEYDASAPLERAWTIPASWYHDERIEKLENRTVFCGSWQLIGRAEQVAQPGQFITAAIAGEPVVAVRDSDGRLRAFFNVCRHHAAAVVTEASGCTNVLRCPYHGWTYGLDGALKGTPDFGGVQDFDPAANGLVPVQVEQWEQFIFANLCRTSPSLVDYFGPFIDRVGALELSKLRFVERKQYELRCNWKVFVDNYLDGGYHVPYVHKGLNSVLDYSHYSIENAGRGCLQSSPVESSAATEQAVGETRKGAAYYFWFYPNFMLNWYEGVLDTNLVLPLGIDRTLVVFDFYFGPEFNDEAARRSVAVSDRIQDEDVAICEAVQRGLGSCAYKAGRLSLRREAGEHLFHRLLAQDLKRGLEAGAAAE